VARRWGAFVYHPTSRWARRDFGFSMGGSSGQGGWESDGEALASVLVLGDVETSRA
jgi:hypothetical protein